MGKMDKMDLATHLAVRKQTGLSMPSDKSLRISQLTMLLGEMAMKRGAEAGPETLKLFAGRLSTLPASDVDAAIEQLGDRAPQRYEPAFPTWPTLHSLVLDQSHPLKHLRMIIRKLGRNFNVTVDEEMLENYQEAAGYRTDEDLDKAREHFLRYYTGSEMPTGGQFREACGIPRSYRPGSAEEAERRRERECERTGRWGVGEK